MTVRGGQHQSQLIFNKSIKLTTCYQSTWSLTARLWLSLWSNFLVQLVQIIESRLGAGGGDTSACPLNYRRGLTRALYRADSAHSRCSPGAAGPLNPRVIQESGLTHVPPRSVAASQQRSSRVGDCALSSLPDSAPRDGGLAQDFRDNHSWKCSLDSSCDKKGRVAS